jgi:hypothetical protein
MSEVQQTTPTEPQRPKGWWRSRRGRVVLAVVSVVVGLAVIGSIADQRKPTRWNGTRGDVLLDEDFGSATPEFSTDTDRFVDLTVVNEEYRVTVRDSSRPQAIRNVFPHTFPSVRFDATATLLTGVPKAVASVGCWAGSSSYLFLLVPDGRVELLETIDESTGERRDLTDLIDADGARPPGQPNRLRIDCVGGGTDATVVTGYVNGHVQLSVAVPDGYDSFNAVGFWVGSETEGAVFTFDDAIATAERGAPRSARHRSSPTP